MDQRRISTLDCIGLKCPHPVLRTRRALMGLRAGEQLVVQTTDPMAEIDIPHLVSQLGHTLVATARSPDGLDFTIEAR